MNLTIPLKALEDTADDGKPVAPAVGDEVSVPDVRAVITKIDGDNAEVELKSAAGCDCADDAESPAEDATEPTEESVMALAKKADGE